MFISTVSLVRRQTYNNSNIEAAIEKALELIGGNKSYVKPGDRVLLKILSKQVLQTDVLISLPKLKTHGLTLFTGGVKNNFGCVTGLNLLIFTEWSVPYMSF